MKNLVTILILGFALASCQSPEARKPVSVKTGAFIDRSVELNKKLNELHLEQIHQIIQNNPDKAYIATPNGFWYYYDVKVEDDSITAKFGDIASFIYDVKDFNDNYIYTKEEIGIQNYAMEQEELFSGLREGLKLMKAGETVTFLFPSHKAYGYYGDSDKIGANMPLKCNVMLHAIKQNQVN